MPMRCPRCGGSLIGDGYSMVVHCEFAEDDEIWETEPDAGIILCKETSDAEEETASRSVQESGTVRGLGQDLGCQV